MNKLKRFKIGLFTITLGMVLVGASFALADDKAIAEGIILPEELNETTAILTPSVAIIEGIGERTVQDRGGAISGQKIDVFFNNHEDALHFGRQEIRIKVISDTER